MSRVRDFVVTGLIGLVAVYVELLIGVATGIAMLRELARIRRARRLRRPVHLADRMDRAHREAARRSTWPPH